MCHRIRSMTLPYSLWASCANAPSMRPPRKPTGKRSTPSATLSCPGLTPQRFLTPRMFLYLGERVPHRSVWNCLDHLDTRRSCPLSCVAAEPRRRLHVLEFVTHGGTRDVKHRLLSGLPRPV